MHSLVGERGAGPEGAPQIVDTGGEMETKTFRLAMLESAPRGSGYTKTSRSPVPSPPSHGRPPHRSDPSVLCGARPRRVGRGDGWEGLGAEAGGMDNACGWAGPGGEGEDG